MKRKNQLFNMCPLEAYTSKQYSAGQLILGLCGRKLLMFAIVLLGIGVSQLNAQEYLELIYNPNSNTTLAEIQTKAEAYFADRDKVVAVDTNNINAGSTIHTIY